MVRTACPGAVLTRFDIAWAQEVRCSETGEAGEAGEARRREEAGQEEEVPFSPSPPCFIRKVVSQYGGTFKQTKSREPERRGGGR